MELVSIEDFRMIEDPVLPSRAYRGAIKICCVAPIHQFLSSDLSAVAQTDQVVDRLRDS